MGYLLFLVGFLTIVLLIGAIGYSFYRDFWRDQ